jgi:hypothetical protein
MEGQQDSAEAGPSTPRRARTPSPSYGNGLGSLLSTSSADQTAPLHDARHEAPDAPRHESVSQELLSATPISAATPTVKNNPDVSEFDPFAIKKPDAKLENLGASQENFALPSSHTASANRTRPSHIEEPIFNFPGFLKDLRLKPAEPVARYLKRWGKA